LCCEKKGDVDMLKKNEYNYFQFASKDYLSATAKRIRKKIYNYNQVELCRKSNISISTIHRIENNKNYSANSVLGFLKALNCALAVRTADKNEYLLFTDKDVAVLLKHLRTKNKVTQKIVSKYANISKISYWGIENNKMSLSITTLINILMLYDSKIFIAIPLLRF
jgi:transcriptional regulator with XRE-family HTH domain